ncbi:MAG: hypothetical protein M3188_07970, partial [Actinomycetota bacterium]|nr:hypothetical protein [Actinomycetota bacterium]
MSGAVQVGAGMAGPGLIRVRGAAVLYRLHDVGYEIHLDRALELLASSAPERARPSRAEAQAIEILTPPVSVSLGPERLVVGGRPLDAHVSARIFHFGVVSLRVRVTAPTEMTWEEFTAFGNAVQAADSAALFSAHLQALAARIESATERPFLAPLTEDYIMFRVNGLRVVGGEVSAADALRHVDVAPLLLNESRPLSRAAREEMLPHRFSYYADDLAILTWENALVVDPASAEETDVEYVLEFANAQLLELRYYDALLDAELPRIYDRVTEHRAGRYFRRFTMLLADLQTLVADSTETVERAENALKVTDDVYLARIYT